MNRVQAEERFMLTRKRMQNTQHKYLQLPVKSTENRDGSKYLVLLASNLLKALLPVKRNPLKEPKRISSQRVEFSQHTSQVECRSASFQIQICLFQLPVQTTKHFSNTMYQFSLLRYPNWLFFSFSLRQEKKYVLSSHKYLCLGTIKVSIHLLN